MTTNDDDNVDDAQAVIDITSRL